MRKKLFKWIVAIFWIFATPAILITFYSVIAVLAGMDFDGFNFWEQYVFCFICLYSAPVLLFAIVLPVVYVKDIIERVRQ